MLPSTEPVAVAMVVILGVIVAWDAWWLTRQHLDICLLYTSDAADE